jgi:hypothetical protein
MNGKKAKAIRRAMRSETAKGTTMRAIYHPSTYINMRNEHCLRFRAQYVKSGGEQLVDLGKKIYDIAGVLPRGQ